MLTVFRCTLVVSVAAILLVARQFPNSCGADSLQPALPEKSFTIYPIGHVERKGGRTFLVIHERYQPGLVGLENWSHIHVLWWFDRNDQPDRRAILQVHPRGDKNNPLTGVFACRAPVRPNLIGLTLCRVLKVEAGVIEIGDIDALDGTPILDIKPFVPGTDCAQDVRVPAWAGPK
ncbi:MAG: tRNA (N6-threonylcarbamoyladenosine(37)-N6)-methyltransferase TrmO [Thermoguttaceae bacterium]|nr:tRNA (N6-threonylcarbamoyladenosine(37)-N6)-methyltransferase TrmO [Thermoguttaceae bacterium]MDW8078370.1 tRNA (N6-threonylcarbamoyladenosine(37)-N6)-methyltransferase TrmO [Thermoguttaceae bacterium]